MPIQDRLPKSRITLTYRTTISGQEQEVDLPFRVLVLGDFSQGSSTDRKRPAEGTTTPAKDIDLEERQIRSVGGGGKYLDKLMADMKMSLSLTVKDRTTVGSENAPADGLPDLQVSLPITSMKSFHPDEIVKQVPKLRALRLMRALLESAQSNIDNQKALRLAIYELYKNEADVTTFRTALADFQPLKLPAAASNPTPPPTPAPTPNPAPPKPAGS